MRQPFTPRGEAKLEEISVPGDGSVREYRSYPVIPCILLIASYDVICLHDCHTLKPCHAPGYGTVHSELLFQQTPFTCKLIYFKIITG